jgi:alkanesulfonate monooxygenase SsuD/methylene tetrahydromethanopterin reductase-like flavin-dependent oxidoreductase (luciferase family)
MARDLSFGISVTPYAQTYPEIVEQVLAAEALGLDLVGIQDHPYQRRFLDTFALIADLLARTSRITIFPDVANLPLRDPPMIAKAAASIDVMSGGRFELGLGSGLFWDAVAGMGGPRRSAREAFAAMEESIAIIRAALDTVRIVRGTGPHYPVPGYPPGPPPAHRVGIWLGVYRTRGLRLAGTVADGWVPSLGYMDPPAYARASAVIDAAAAAAGRDPDDVRRLYNLGGMITDGERGDDHLTGPVDHGVATLSAWAVEIGVDSFVFWPPDSGTQQVERFAREVAPAVRAATGR